MFAGYELCLMVYLVVWVYLGFLLDLKGGQDHAYPDPPHERNNQAGLWDNPACVT